MIARFRRKILDVRRYSALASRPADRRDLLLLGLWRNRLLRATWASRLTSTHSRGIAPRLNVTRGEPVSIHLGDYGEIDCFDELFIDQIYALESVPFRPDLVADCGAYHGYFSVLSAGYFPTAAAACFEPNPDHHPALRAQLALLSRPTELISAAVGVRDGRVAFAGSGMGGAIVEHADTAGAREVPLLDFPRWLADRRPERLVWKLDVEGAETELLPATLPYLPRSTVIFLETHSDDAHCAALLEPYRSAGFSLHEVRRRPADGFAYIEWRLIRT